MYRSLAFSAFTTAALLGLPGHATAQCDWIAASGLLPDQHCPPWTLGLSGGGASPVLAQGAVTISTTTVGQNVYYSEQDPQLSLPATLVIEATVEFVSGFSNDLSRAPGVIGFDVASGWGNMLFIGDDEVFLNQSGGGSSCSKRGPAANVTTKGGFHTYRIEVNTTPGGSIKVFYDGLQVLSGATFAASTQCFTGAPRIFWGEGSSSAFGVLRWSDFSHNATVCPAAIETVRAGTPPNPNALMPGQTSGPVLGVTWDPVIDHAAFLPGSILDFLAISLTPTNLPSPFGTILCGTTPVLLLTTTQGTPFTLPLPTDCNLMGVSLCAQGGGLDGAGVIALTNAIDISLGSY